MLGILGGMGPVATADFFTKLLAETPARGDEDHLPVLLLSDPDIPSRPAAIRGAGPSPLPRLRALRDKLVAAGATTLAMPCNTAHHWYGELAADCPVPFLSIVAASCDALADVVPRGGSVALLGTQATLDARLYDAPLATAGYTLLLPTPAQMETAVLPAIALVKGGAPAAAAPLLVPVIDELLARGADAVLLACTELPLALAADGAAQHPRCVDSNRALARACVRHFRGGAR